MVTYGINKQLYINELLAELPGVSLAKCKLSKSKPFLFMHSDWLTEATIKIYAQHKNM